MFSLGLAILSNKIQYFLLYKRLGAREAASPFDIAAAHLEADKVVLVLYLVRPYYQSTHRLAIVAQLLRYCLVQGAHELSELKFETPHVLKFVSYSVINVPQFQIVELPFFEDEIELETVGKVGVEVVEHYFSFRDLGAAFLFPRY